MKIVLFRIFLHTKYSFTTYQKHTLPTAPARGSSFSLLLFLSMADKYEYRVHGTGGVWMGGDWLPIEECAERFNASCGDCERKRAGACHREGKTAHAPPQDGVCVYVCVCAS